MYTRRFKTQTACALMAAIPLLATLFCAAPRRETPDTLRFALTGNTYPDSPFRGTNSQMGETALSLNRDNPVFVAHLGDIVFGGHDWMGIRDGDLIRQYDDYMNASACMRPLRFFARGEMDLLNHSDELYRKYTRQKPYYSFNYGNIHCVVIDTTGDTKAGSAKTQMNWLKADLRRHRDRAATIVFAHHPLVPIPGLEPQESVSALNAGELHELFRQYGVRAVFSGHVKQFYQTEKDKILYVAAGCEFNSKPVKGARYQSRAAYYLVDYDRDAIKISRRGPDGKE